MKFKTLCIIMLVMLATVFAVACGGEDDTTTAEANGDPNVTTTAATTTTTKETTTKATTAATTTVTTQKREITFEIPSKLPDGKTYDATLLFDGTEADNTISDQKAVDKGNSFDIFTVGSNKVFAYHAKATYSQAALNFTPYKFAGDETGILFYMDTSLVAADDADAVTSAYGPRFKIDSTWYQAGSHSNSVMKQPTLAHNYIYKLLDGTAEWVKIENHDNCRAVFGAGFKGWVYIPLDQLSYNGENAQTLPDYIATYPGECELTSFMVYAGKTGIPAEGTTAEVYFDNLLIVKSK